MLRITFFIFTLFIFLDGASIKDIEKKIDSKQREINDVTYKKSGINKNINILASKINKEEESYDEIISILEKTNTQILLNNIKLTSAKSKVGKLKKRSDTLLSKKTKIEQDVIDFVIERYAMSMGIEQAKKESLRDVIAKELYTLVFDNTRQDILNINIDYLKINNAIRDNEKKIKNLNRYINKQRAIKEKYKNLQASHERSLGSLKKKHNLYQKNLQKLVNKQNSLNDLLSDLNILKKQEIKKEKSRIKRAKELARKKEIERKKREAKARLAKLKKSKTSKKKTTKKPKVTKTLEFKKKQKLDKNIDVEVRKIGSSVKGIKISKYRGVKTMAPLKSYKVTKKFGKYYDSVYKMELFNESVSLKTKKPNAKVYSVFGGQIVYAKQNQGLLENVVIVKHKNSLHTIYSHLDKISPTLKVGKYIPKGYVVGRVNDTLEFQATKNSRYIDPMRLIKR